MRLSILFFLLAFISLLAIGGRTLAADQDKSAGQETGKPVEDSSLLAIHVTSQSYNNHTPWLKQSILTRTYLGVLVGKNQILVTASALRNHTLIEVQLIGESQERLAAKVVLCDYIGDLALLEVNKPDKIAALQPMPLATRVDKTKDVNIFKWHPVEMYEASPGKIKKMKVVPSYISKLPLSAFLVEANLSSYSGGKYSLPVTQSGKLLGLSSGGVYRNQPLKIIPAAHIKHFIDDLTQGDYRGFPHLGIIYTDLKDPNTRQWLKLPQNSGGVWIQKVLPGTSAYPHLKKGDVILKVEGKNIDTRGYYQDKEWGRLRFPALITGKLVGDKLDLTIFRQGKEIKMTLKLQPFKPNLTLIPRYLYDRPVNYLFYAGFLFQELTRGYLQRTWNWGWELANSHYYYILHSKNYPTLPKQKRVVFLNRVFPHKINHGYEGLKNCLVKSINQHQIHSIGQIQEALKSYTKGGVQVFNLKCAYSNVTVFVDAHAAQSLNGQIRKNYDIPKSSFIQEYK